MQQEERQEGAKHRFLSLGPSPRLLHSSPDVGSSLGRAGIAREIVVFKGTFNPVLESCHWHKRRHRRRCLRRRVDPGTWWRSGSVRETDSITSVPFGEKEKPAGVGFPLLFSLFIELGDFLREGLGHRILLAAVTLEPNEREESVRLLVFGFAVGKAGKSAEPPPVRRARIGIVAAGQRLCGEGAKQLWKHSECLSQAWKLPALVSTTAQGVKPSAESSRARSRLRSSRAVKRCSPDGRM
jgi:hypothetical protein